MLKFIVKKNLIKNTLTNYVENTKILYLYLKYLRYNGRIIIKMGE